ncbi:MAG: DUF1800 family protein [Chitinophagales bacterium]
MASIAEKNTPLGFAGAMHLLRRATYRPSKARANALAGLTPAQALDQLFTFTAPAQAKPIKNTDGSQYFPDFNNPGATFDATYNNDYSYEFINYWLHNAHKSDTIQWKLSMFLHSIYITTYTSVYMQWDNMALLLQYTNKSLKELAFKMTLNQRMIYFLSNYLNIKTNPNQHYSREFLELFTILKGEQIEEGNYTNYTEHDVQQAARVLTGFTGTYGGNVRMNYLDKGLTTNIAGHAPNPTNAGWTYAATNLPTGLCNLAQHDTGNKTFSSAFGGQTINGSNTLTGAYTVYDELQAFINMVFNQQETARNYARRLYRFFVNSNITQEVEIDIITPLSTHLLSTQNGITYNLESAVKMLLKSWHFYDEEDSIVGDEHIGSKIKSPVELMLNFMAETNIATVNPTTNPLHFHNFYNTLRSRIWISGIQLFNSVDVSGYPGYSAKPDYDKNWVTIATLNQRYKSGWIETYLNGYTNNGFTTRLDSPDYLRLSGWFTDPGNADTLIDEIMDLLFPSKPKGLRYGYFENALLNGLSKANWQTTWNTWIADVNNATKKNAVRTAVNRLLLAMARSTEYQVM